MKSFLTGFIVFLGYTAICLVLLELAIPTLGLITPATEQDLMAEESLKDSFKKDSYDSNEVLLEEDFKNSNIDSTLFIEDDEYTLETQLIEEPLPVVDDSSASSIPIVNSAIPLKFNILLPNGSFLISCNEYPTIYKDVAKVKIPYVCREYGIAIKNYLESNPSTTLLITGFSDPSEQIVIGKNRADYLKRLLGTTGIDNGRILTAAAVRSMDLDKGYTSGGILMEIKGKSANTVVNRATNPSNNFDESGTSTTLTQASILSNKKFTSGFQGNYFYGDQKFTSYTITLKNLLNQNPGSKIYAYSYTNQEGEEKDNFAISRDNASTVRKILIQSGIPSSRITSVARGEQNSGTSGPNRCVIITVK